MSQALISRAVMPNTDAEPGIPPGKGRCYVLMVLDRQLLPHETKLRALLELTPLSPVEIPDMPGNRQRRDVPALPFFEGRRR